MKRTIVMLVSVSVLTLGCLQARHSTDVEHITSKVPEGYYDASEKQGRMEEFIYQTEDYLNGKGIITKKAIVYLPYGYDDNDTLTRYNILYLMHGAMGNETTYLGSQTKPTHLKNMIDHMIADRMIESLIIVAPTIEAGSDYYVSSTTLFDEELLGYLMAAVESKYHTYAESVTADGLVASRSHRAFGGFSAGGTTTWNVFLNGLSCIKYFMPLSGMMKLPVGEINYDAMAQELADAAKAAGREFCVFAATGTRDVAYEGMNEQIEKMKSLSDVFQFTDKGFNEGNLMYYTVEGNPHDYPYTYEYIFNGLPLFFD